MRRYFLSAAALALAACSDNTGPTPAGTVGLGFQVARTSASANVAALNVDGPVIVGEQPVVTPTASGLSVTRDDDVLLITRAQVVVKDVKLAGGSADCDGDDDNLLATSTSADASLSRSHPGDDDDHDCPTIHTGPFLVDVPVNGTDGARVVVPIAEGTYSSVRLTLHKVTSNDSADRAFRQANPDFRDISVRLEGTYNGVPFIYVGDVNLKVDVPLDESLVVGETGGDVTVTLDFGSWFVRPQEGLYSPALANTPGGVRSAVENNIGRTFRAFCDRNRDGRSDR